MGYSRKNPHLPDGWHAGNSRGRGVEGSGNPGRRGGLDLKTPLRGSLKMLTQFFRSLTLRKKLPPN